MYGLDRVRVLAIVVVFLFHCARFFDSQDWHVKNTELSAALTLFTRFVSLWIMPLFFFISGISARYAMKHGARGYMESRVTRLLVPFLLGTFVVLAPAQVWVERVSRGAFSGSFLEFYPEYFSGWYGFGGNFAWMGLHLWYLEMLFIFSVITIPVFLFMKRRAGERPPSKAGLAGPMLWMVLPVIAAELVSNLDPGLAGRRDWGGWPLLSHLAFFSSGYYAALRPAVLERLASSWKKNLAWALAVTAFLAAILGVLLDGTVVSYLLASTLLPAASLLWIAAITGMGMGAFNFPGSALAYGNEAVLPFYVLHQTVIVLVGFYIRDWNAGVAAKYALLSGASFIVIMLIYECAVRRVNLLRVLFGMKAYHPPKSS
jgi:hypothetical protein